MSMRERARSAGAQVTQRPNHSMRERARSVFTVVACAAALLLVGTVRAEEQPPLVVDVKRKDWSEGVYGGEMRMLMAKDRDIRMMVVYGYSRLVGYDEQLKIVPDIVEKLDDEGSRVFTFHLRRGHKELGNY